METYTLPLQDTQLFYITSAIQSAAGIVCFAIDPRNSSITVLLGRETPYGRHHRKGVWCEFGGKRERTETPVETAAREFTEESLGVVKLNKHSYFQKQNYAAAVKHVLLKQTRMTKFTVCISNRKVNRIHKVNLKTYFILQIPWQPGVPQIFLNVREKLAFARHNEQQGRANPGFPFSLLSHPAVSRDKGSISINKRYLEKQEIGWWPLSNLKYVLNINGRYKTHRFRKSFMDPLRRIIDILKLKL